MHVAIIVSQNDPAGMNISFALQDLGFAISSDTFEDTPTGNLVTRFHSLALYTTKRDSIRCENIDEEIDADVFVFATRHVSKAGIPSLTVHAPGNIGPADFGGSPRQLCVSAEPFIKRCFQLLKKNAPKNFEVIEEATHHGPLIKKPCLFIELGSDEEGWNDPDGARAIARTIIECFSEPQMECETAIGIGGQHHAPAFAGILAESAYAISHVCPKHSLEFLDGDMLAQMLARSMSPAKKAFLDWKGIGTHKQRILKLLALADIPFEKV